MQLQVVPAGEAVGKILVHNVAGESGRKAFSKGHVVREDDVAVLAQLGLHAVYVAQLEPGDVHEDEAAARLAAACAGAGVATSQPTTGRVNFFPAWPGVLKVDVAGLGRINALDGLTVATLPANSLVQLKRMIATVKIIPFAVPETVLRQAEGIARESGSLVQVMALRQVDVGLILTGSAQARGRVFETFEPAIQGRVETLGSRLLPTEYVPEDEQQIAAAITRLLAQGAGLVILAGETSIMDADDITPRGIRRAGGMVARYGAPVEPGNLLLVAYRDGVPILGAPGCIRSRETNVVDLILPRLLAGERLGKDDIVALGVGGLMV